MTESGRDVARSIDMRTRFVAMAAVALAIGAFVVVYHGPGRELLRGHVGDGAATLLVYAALGFALPRLRIRTRAVATLAIALAIEVGQLVWHASSFAAEMTIGGTFDPWDVLAYAIGVAVAVAWESRGRSADANRTAADPRV